jgi:hypothetical protein
VHAYALIGIITHNPRHNNRLPLGLLKRWEFFFGSSDFIEIWTGVISRNTGL